MMILNVITRDNSPHQGKATVYISYYEADRKKVAESIAAVFLKHRNCAIYYADDVGAGFSVEEKAEIFKDMQAIVFPLFAEQLLLIVKSGAELELCKQEHIPVLPILMDNKENAEFYEKYQEVFGSYQLLMPYVVDSTKIPFDEILEERLKNIFTSDRDNHYIYQREGVFPDKFTNMIQSAFRGSVFLSYRKSDRKLARKMIGAIRSDPRLIDVMIWFDEYLVPGEDYNDELQRRISECDVFLILGTEAAVQEDNYILKHEYPEARDAEKLMILICADKSVEIQCRHLFSYAKTVIETDKISSIGSILAEILREKKGKMDAKPLEKAYLLGKAYLDGVLTEVNRAEGVHLVEQAAVGGNVSAMRLLAHLYHEGIGVERNPEKEFAWLAEAADAVEGSMDVMRHGFKDLHELIDLNWQQGDIRLRQVDFEGAFKCYNRMLEAARNIKKHDNDILSFSTYEIMALNKLANVRTYQGRLCEAREYIKEALRVHERSGKQALRIGGDIDYAETLMMLGNIERDEKNYSAALHYYQQSLDVAKELNKFVFSSRAYDLRCDVSESIGIIAMEQGDFRLAEEAFAEEFKLGHSFEKEFGEERALGFEMAALRRLGDVARAVGDLQRGTEYYCQSVEYARKINQIQKTHSSLGMMLNVLLVAGKSLYQIKDYDQAKVYLNEVNKVIIESECSKETGKIAVFPKIASDVCKMLGDIAYIENRPAHSRALYKRMAVYCQEIFDRERSDNNMMELAAANYKIISSNKYVNDPECTRTACELYKSLYYKYDDERLGNLYRKSLQIQQNHENNVLMHRMKIAGWASDLLEKLHLIELYGIRCSDTVSNVSRVTTEIMEMVLDLVDYESQITDRLVDMMNSTLRMNLSVDEMKHTFCTICFFKSENKDVFSKQVPESIKFLAEVDRLSRKQMDYHDGLAFQLRIILDIIGRWALDLIGSSVDKQEHLIEFIDRIELYLEE